MSSEDRRIPDDQELDDFVAGRHPISGAYRQASSEDPAIPDAIDAKILAQARESVRHLPRRRPRWLQPVAVAAAMILSVGVLINIWREPAMLDEAVPSVEVPASGATIDLRRERVAEKSSNSGLEVTSAEDESDVGFSASAKSSGQGGADITASSPELPIRREAPRLQVQADRSGPASVAPPSEARPEVESAAMPEAAAGAESLSAFPADRPEKSVLKSDVHGARNDRRSRLEEKERGLEQAQKARRAKAEARRDTLAPETLNQYDQAVAATAARPQGWVDADATPNAGNNMPLPEADDATLSAEWIKRMREALERGDQREARSLLKQYRARFPDQQLPADLSVLETPPSAQEPP